MEENNSNMENEFKMKIEQNDSIQQKLAAIENQDKKPKKSKKPILIPAAVILVIAIIVILFIKVGTSFKEVRVSNNHSVEYSSKLLKEVYDKNTNVLLSDLTLNPGLTFFYKEGNEKVKSELKGYFGLEPELLIGNYNNIHKRYKGAFRKVSFASSIWIKDGSNSISESAKDTAKKLNFETKADFSADKMNKWIKKKSHNKVEGNISDGDLADAHSVIISTLYFNEKWKTKYEKKDIREGTFYGESGDDQVTYLKSDENIYMETTNARGFMRPYKDEGLYFVGMIPNENKTIKDINISELFKNKKPTSVSVEIPEFEYSSDIDFDTVLPKMNVKSIFEYGNLEGIAPQLYVKRVYQMNYIKVDRNGTQAVSVDFNIDKQWGSIVQPRTVFLDKPFIFAIYDETIDQILFIGQVNNIRNQG